MAVDPVTLTEKDIYNRNGIYGPGQTTGSCQIKQGPPVFIFESPAVQNAANSIYESKKAFDALPANKASNRVKTFKSDYERMQYKLGLYGRTSTGNA